MNPEIETDGPRRRRHWRWPASLLAMTLLGVGAAALGTAPAQADAGTGDFQNGYNNLCLDDWADNMWNGAEIDQYTCNNDSNAQNWWFSGFNSGGNDFGTIYMVGTNFCLDDPGSSNTPGTLVDLWQCNGTSAQQWQYNGYALWNEASDMCLDDPGWSGQPGQALQLWNCNGGENQQWPWAWF